MRVGASLMLGWVCLLLWADRKPVERKGVLLLTIIPVLVLLIYSGLYAVTTNFITARSMAPTWIMQGALLLYGFSYWNANGLDVNQQHKQKIEKQTPNVFTRHEDPKPPTQPQSNGYLIEKTAARPLAG